MAVWKDVRGCRGLLAVLALSLSLGLPGGALRAEQPAYAQAVAAAVAIRVLMTGMIPVTSSSAVAAPATAMAFGGEGSSKRQEE